MCNYLNNDDNLNGCSLHSVYIFMKNVQKNVFLIYLVIFQKCAAVNKVTMVSKHILFQIALYPWHTGQYMLPY